MSTCQAHDCTNHSTYTVKGYHLCSFHSLSDVRQDDEPTTYTPPSSQPRPEHDKETDLPRFLRSLKRQELMQAAASTKDNADPHGDPIQWTSLTNDEMVDYIMAHQEGVQEFMTAYNDAGGKPPLTPRQEQYLNSLIKKAAKNHEPYPPTPAEKQAQDGQPYTKQEASRLIDQLKNNRYGKGQGSGEQGGEPSQDGQPSGGDPGQGGGGQDSNEYVTHPELAKARKDDTNATDKKFYERDLRLDNLQGRAATTDVLLEQLQSDLSDVRQHQQENGTYEIVVAPRAEREEGERIPVTGHARLPQVIMALEAEEHVMLVGPAGTGKSTIAMDAARSLGLDFYSISLGPTTPTSKMFGYLNAQGELVRTPFMDAWEYGGLMLVDEIDNGHPGLTAETNQALAGGMCAFAHGMVPKHPDFRLVATANTFGRGADRQYVGRNPLDAATLDRFITIEVHVDEKLEAAIAKSLRHDPMTEEQVDQWVSDVRQWRAAAEEARLNVVISPRATFAGVKLMSAGFSRKQVIESKITPGLTEKDARLLGVK